ncbi:MAG TPA: DUF2142 domain-containing protein, partial [Solirubrobacteraceae bacterium]|nr:DUF2142 domain-containing protein [Solirubrobacteraceae bacterium]
GRSRRPARRLRGALARVPTAAWICALVATLNAVSWSVLTPPFQVPDEPSHFAYVQHLAETGHLPSSAKEVFPPAEEVALTDLDQREVRFAAENPTISTQAQQERLEVGLAEPLSRSQPGDAGLAASQPPLYYALETIPYALGTGGTVLDRLELMRLFSALLGGLTALLTFMFIREALPGARWAWTVGGLAVALMPALAMMAGAVNPDALLFALSSALFYCLARGFRRGMTRGLAVALGATIAAGCLTKLTFAALLPGALAGLLLLAARGGQRRGYRLLALALGVAAVPAGIYALRDASSGTPSTHVFSGALGLAGHHSLTGALGYLWQLYLPRLPGMTPAFHGTNGSLLWFDTMVGQYGWLDTSFQPWAVEIALVAAALLAVLLVRALVADRRRLRTRWLELGVYALMGLGVLLAIGLDEYIHGAQGEYLEYRYLLPLVALMGAGLALAARGAGRRWGPVAGALIVMLFLAHDLFSQLLVISRYYG